MLYANIESDNLFSYFKQSAIMPGRYFIRDFPSEQEIFRYHVLVSEHKWINYSDVSLELDLSGYKLIPLERGLYLIDGIVPLSRVKKIWFKDISQMYRTVDFLKSKSVLISDYVHDEDIKVKIMCIEFVEERFSKDIADHSDLVQKTEMYRRYLGALSVIRPFFPKDHDYIRKNLTKGGNHSLLKLLKGNSTLLQSILEGRITLKTVRAVAKKYGESVDVTLEDRHRTRDFILDQQISIDKLNKNGVPYVFAILFKYYSNLDGLLVEIAHLLPENEERAKGILFCFGLMKAYNRLPNEFNIGNKKYPLKLIFDRNKQTYQYDMDTLEYVHKSIFRSDVETKESESSLKPEKPEENVEPEKSEEKVEAKESESCVKSEKSVEPKESESSLKPEKAEENVEPEKSEKMVKLKKYERKKIIKETIEESTLDDYLERFDISKQILKSDIKRVIISLDVNFKRKFFLFQKFKLRMNKNYFNEQFEEVIKKEDTTLEQLAKELGISERSLKLRIKNVADIMEHSYSYKSKVLKKFGIRTSKKMRISTLKNLLKASKLTTKELSKKLGVTVVTVRKYLKEVGASRDRLGRRIEYSLNELEKIS